ncbi:manganese efflux pump MntP family protein [Sedimentisphaera salicampi]|nr:manganese efflux pump MntP family protein [Sedimentisphaera salicampi]
MPYIEITALALGLAMDAFSVSLAIGATYKELKFSRSMFMAMMFGLFQALMPLAGFFAGGFFSKYLQNAANLLAFAILSFLGIKMIYEAGKLLHTGRAGKVRADVAAIIVLAFATSIDALAAGFTITLFDASVWFAVTIIGVITFLLSIIGTELGCRAGHLFENKTEFAGGIILIALGIKILIFG